MSPKRTWILIADAAHARAYLSIHPGARLERVAGFELTETIPHARDLSPHQPGTSQPSIGSAHHTVGPATDPRREVKRNFATRVAEALEAAHKQGLFEQLVIACPPAMLGDLRAVLAKPIAHCVVAELPKDLVKTPDHELLSHFSAVPALVRAE
jgi:protein required for attachment to host cells